MSGRAEAVVAAVLLLGDAMAATAHVRVRHRLPNSCQALAMLLHVEPGQKWTPKSLAGFGTCPTYALRSLHEAGLVEQAGEARDRRTRALRLTAQGEAVADELRRALGGAG